MDVAVGHKAWTDYNLEILIAEMASLDCSVA